MASAAIGGAPTGAGAPRAVCAGSSGWSTRGGADARTSGCTGEVGGCGNGVGVGVDVVVAVVAPLSVRVSGCRVAMRSRNAMFTFQVCAGGNELRHTGHFWAAAVFGIAWRHARQSECPHGSATGCRMTSKQMGHSMAAQCTGGKHKRRTHTAQRTKPESDVQADTDNLGKLA